MKSTSIHNLNADSGLSKPKKALYLFLNWINNLFPYFHVDPRIEFKNFGSLNWKKAWDKTFPASSAARKSSDLFWQSLLWKEIEKELGGKIHIFDTGCGQGNYGLRISEGSEGRLTSYTGIDAKRRPNWQKLEAEHPKFHFIESRSTDILPLIPKETNLFITQSAIEHFNDDLVFFEKIREFSEKAGHPVAQIHLFPGGITLPLYLFHGYRQYVPRTISKITRLFSDQYSFELYGLGGRACAKLHFRYFTWPVLITRKYEKPTFDEKEYEPLLRKAIEQDAQGRINSPLFWALIVKPQP